MRCPNCDSRNTYCIEVADSDTSSNSRRGPVRWLVEGNTTARKRGCKMCNDTFYTLEVIMEDPPHGLKGFEQPIIRALGPEARSLYARKRRTKTQTCSS